LFSPSVSFTAFPTTIKRTLPYVLDMAQGYTQVDGIRKIRNGAQHTHTHTHKKVRPKGECAFKARVVPGEPAKYN